ncbi:MAG: hypothetical protein ACREJ2_08020 [Planctomycetota bacterium]
MTTARPAAATRRRALLLAAWLAAAGIFICGGCGSSQPMLPPGVTITGHPADDARDCFARGQVHYLALEGFGLTVPGIDAASLSGSTQVPVIGLPTTDDAGNDHSAEYETYCEGFNRAMLAEIQAHPAADHAPSTP